MVRHRLARAAVLIAALIAGALTVPPQARAAEVCFAETGFCVQGRFLDYWQQNGGLARNGFPLSAERRELLEDGHEYTVQYFERVRMEYHPENPTPYDVLLGQFGRRILRDQFGLEVARYQATVAPVQPVSGQAYFPETGHNVPPDFLAYWAANGGLAQFGYPLTDVFEQGLEDSRTYQVQYFERARFERHPEHAGIPYTILLGQFGRAILAQVDQLAGRIGALYTTDERVRGLLGVPAALAVQVQGETQAFERGRMFLYREREGFVGLISALCGDPQSGRAFTSSRLEFYFLDPWDPSQPAGGGPGPGPGLYEPQRGFGRIWRESAGYLEGVGSPTTAVRDCLGFATSPEETTYAITVQFFARGVLLTTPDDQAAYVVYLEAAPGGGVAGRYERVALPAR